MVISDAQRKRLFAIIRSSGHDEEEVRSWLAVGFNVTSTKDIKRRDYEFICESIEKPGTLPAPREDREPGEEG